MKKIFFLGLVSYFVFSVLTELVLTSAFGIDTSENRWLIWGITVGISLLVFAIIGLKYLRDKRKKSLN
jgi:FtsH-binding integral membrane protein